MLMMTLVVLHHSSKNLPHKVNADLTPLYTRQHPHLLRDISLSQLTHQPRLQVFDQRNSSIKQLLGGDSPRTAVVRHHDPPQPPHLSSQ